MGSAKVQGGKVPGTAKWRATGNLMYNTKYLHNLAGHWAMAQQEIDRCVPGWTKRERIVLRWLLQHNTIFSELKKKLKTIPDVTTECRHTIHVIAKDRGVVAVVDPKADSYVEGGFSRVVFGCDGNANRHEGEQIDYTEHFHLKTLMMFPLLFPTGDYHQTDGPDTFFQMNERKLLYGYVYQRMRGVLYGYVFQELLVTVRLRAMNPQINKHHKVDKYRTAARGMLLPEEILPSGTCAIRRARGDAFFFHRRAGAGHFFITLTAYMSQLALVFSLSNDEFWAMYPRALSAVNRRDISALRDAIRTMCAGEDGNEKCFLEVLYRDVVAVNAAFRVHLSNIFTSMDEIRSIMFLYGSFEFQCRGLIHFHGVVRFLQQSVPGHFQHLQGPSRLAAMKPSLDSAETIDLEFSASRWSNDADEQDLIRTLQQHDCAVGGCGKSISITRSGKKTQRQVCVRRYPEEEAGSTHYKILPGDE